jgi:hypothetical protein
MVELEESGATRMIMLAAHRKRAMDVDRALVAR